jgi:hypothetical protein
MRVHNITTYASYPDHPIPSGPWDCQAHFRAAKPGTVLRLTSTPEAPNGFVRVAPNARAMMEAVAKQPLVVYFAIADEEVGGTGHPAGAFWMYYQGGAYTAGRCGRSPNHAMLIVGYDTTASPPVWIVRNRWESDRRATSARGDRQAVRLACWHAGNRAAGLLPWIGRFCRAGCWAGTTPC